jgi:truncated hemoglobin YjbI/heme-degrading monooxygenase HmoA
MIVEYIRYTLAVDQAAEFEAAWATAGRLLDADSHCLGWELARGVEHDERYTVRITWDSLDGHLHGFRDSAGFAEFYAAVKPFVDEIDEMTHYAPRDPAVRAERTIFEHAGGAETLSRLTRVFYAKVTSDPLLAPLFAEMAGDHPERVARWLGEVFGGPPAYTATRGGYSTMVLAHLNRDISEEQRARWVELLYASLDEAGLPSDERFRRTFSAYIEWGTRIAERNSKPGFTPPRDAHVPNWSWVDGKDAT